MSQSKTKSTVAIEDQWQSLRRWTNARIGLGHSGASLPTNALLEFQLAHARARDAVHQPLDINQLQDKLQTLGHEVLTLTSQIENRRHYLQRPDLGRRLSAQSIQQLRDYVAGETAGPDLAIVVSEGLSSSAIEHHAYAFLSQWLTHIGDSYRIGPICIVQQGRVAVADDVAQTLNAQMVMILIGERPGLSSPDSLGIYFTYAPRTGMTDERRNCLSNIHHAGMSYQQACIRLAYLMEHAKALGQSGVALKDQSETPALHGENFLLP